MRVETPQRPKPRDGLAFPMARIGGSTYSKRPLAPQVRDLREAGFDHAELDLTWLEPGPALEYEALALAEVLPLDTAHLPPSRFTPEDRKRFEAFLDYTAMAGPKVYNVHLVPSKKARGVPLDVRTAWIADLADAAQSRGLAVTIENLDEPLSILAEVFTRIPRARFCLDVGHASLDGQRDKPFQLLDLLGDRLALVHAHDNRQGHGEAGDLHLPFGRGTVDVERVLRAVRDRGFHGPVTLELFSGTKEEKADSLARARASLSG